MIAEAGLAALWFAAALALLQLTLTAFGLAGGKSDLLGAVRPVAVAQGVLTAIAFIALIAAVRAVRHVGRTGRAQQQQPEADALQDRGDVGQS
jgi:cytochrome c biogenesis factor